MGRLERDLNAVLKAERVALLAADWPALEKLTQRKVRLLEALEKDPARTDLGPQALARIGRDASRNQAIMSAAMDGLRDGARRIGEIRNAQSGFASYDSAGRQARVASSSPGLEKRA